MSFLLDTDTCSAHLKNRRTLFSRFMQHQGQLHVSLVTVGELATWAERTSAAPRRRIDLDALLADIQLIDVNREVAMRYGRVRAELLDRGQFIASADGFIAATALVYDLTLVTHNTKDFAAVPGLRLADWLVS